ncbi:serine/threonine-protein kinase RIO3 [Phlebotomus papatasi]|uniref:serine/threonine-protein kinase RIO3 n=1 Tax=Phlebotomus papatasi TaxID=29031 RepID=UPI002483B8DB|nr:serine/threonine-protein kinase RIO3 [Phlebotomus papatasi]XP_055708211.1 serine/threonine-protein kinase RIO3 [Phlebotomus papatasi]
MSSPWKTVAAPEPVNFADIMSEELARELQDKENEKFGRQLFKELSTAKEPDPGEASALPEEVLKALTEGASGVGDHCDSDAIIAQVLQAQFDQEYDQELKKVEQHQNAKVKVSYKNFRIIPEELACEEEKREELEDKKHWDRFETMEKEYGSFPKCGYKQDEEGNTVTKHNARMAGIRNACRVMSFPPEFPTGDGAGFDMQLSNEVYNHLKSYSRKGKRNKMHDRKEEVATAEMGLDEPTRMILYKFVSNQVLERINGIISTGKEALILHAEADTNYSGELSIPPECAVKIFKTTLNEFKQRDRYIKDDFRFRDRFSKQNARTVIHQWAEKEMHNLMRMRRAEIPCPEVVTLKKHVLVMSFIGHQGRAAPKLKEAVLSEAEWIVAYEEVIEAMKLLYSQAKLIHADLSEYNILYHEGKCYLIDVAQSVEPGHPSALEFLMRDCSNISDFFDRRGVPGVASKEELFASITGLDPSVHNAAMLERLHNKGVPEHVATNQGVLGEEDEAGASARWQHKSLPYPFDYAWEKSLEAKRQEAPLPAQLDPIVQEDEVTVQA